MYRNRAWCEAVRHQGSNKPCDFRVAELYPVLRYQVCLHPPLPRKRILSVFPYSATGISYRSGRCFSHVRQLYIRFYHATLMHAAQQLYACLLPSQVVTGMKPQRVGYIQDGFQRWRIAVLKYVVMLVLSSDSKSSRPIYRLHSQFILIYSSRKSHRSNPPPKRQLNPLKNTTHTQSDHTLLLIEEINSVAQH